MYSQNNEESIIIDYFKTKGIRTGTLIDIGAYDGITFSNVRQLILDGWSGVLIEPSPSPFLNCMKLYKDNQNIKLINSAISPQPVTSGLIQFYDCGGDAVSTMSEAHRTKWQKDVKFYPYLCPCVHIEAVYNATGTRFYDFVNLDVEGMNFEILKTLDLNETQLICVEYDDQRNNMEEYLRDRGLYFVAATSENLICAR
jgi:FkbM family methyltransferase